MIPHYSVTDQECNYCKSEIYIGYEFIIHDESYYCDTDCLVDEILDNIHVKRAYLTNDRNYADD